jgi:methyl-accepting chemotaxis protein
MLSLIFLVAAVGTALGVVAFALAMDLQSVGQAAAVERAGYAKILVGVLMLCGGVAGPLSLWFVGQTENRLQAVVDELSQGAEYVSEAAAQVSTSSQRVAAACSESSASIEETTATTDEITSLTAKNAESAASAMEVVTQALERVGESDKAIADCVQAMDSIRDSAAEIQRIIEVIDKIAFQTNILALNAAVEAARAGEQGLGFAVVADEVRTLAQRSAQAATETAALIEKSMGLAMTGHARTEALMEAGKRCNESFQAVSGFVRQIVAASGEQRQGMTGIDQTMVQLSKATQDGAAHAEETAAAAEELQGQSQTLQGVARELDVLVHGAGKS